MIIFMAIVMLCCMYILADMVDKGKVDDKYLQYAVLALLFSSFAFCLYYGLVVLKALLEG